MRATRCGLAARRDTTLPELSARTGWRGLTDRACVAGCSTPVADLLVRLPEVPFGPTTLPSAGDGARVRTLGLVDRSIAAPLDVTPMRFEVGACRFVAALGRTALLFPATLWPPTLLLSLKGTFLVDAIVDALSDSLTCGRESSGEGAFSSAV